MLGQGGVSSEKCGVGRRVGAVTDRSLTLWLGLEQEQVTQQSMAGRVERGKLEPSFCDDSTLGSWGTWEIKLVGSEEHDGNRIKLAYAPCAFWRGGATQG